MNTFFKKTAVRRLAQLTVGLGLVQAAVLFGTSADAEVLLAKSSVTAVAKQMNVPMEGRFKKVNAAIQFNPAQPAQGSAKIEIDTGSFDIGDAAYNSEIVSKTWFNAAQYPKATFVSSKISGSGNRFQVSGKLTIKGKTQEVNFPLSLKTEGPQQIFDGVLPIKRTAFGIGEGEWKDTSIVADEVQIKFHVVNVNATTAAKK